MRSDLSFRNRLPQTVVVVPVYNHGATLRTVVEGVLFRHPHVLVADDGSTDLPGADQVIWNDALRNDTESVSTNHHKSILVNSANSGPESRFVNAQAYGGANNTAGCSAGAAGGMALPKAVFPPEHPLHGLPVAYLRHVVNKGKGAAVLSAAEKAARYGATHIITIDADGQHDPADIVAFFTAINVAPLALAVGCRDFNTENVPFSSRFGRVFSNFWFKVQTGQTLADTQCGFRAYPLAVLERVVCSEKRYSFEVEILVRGAWAGFPVRDVPVSVYYPPPHERVSHFGAFWDNARISWLNTRLTIRAIMPVPQKTYAADSAGRISVLTPLESLRVLLARRETPGKLAVSAFLGMFIGTLPLFGIHSISILLAAGALRLNKITALAVSQLCMPPFVPALCIEVGHYIRRGRFLTEISLQTLGYEALDRVWEWIIGAVMLAPLLGVVLGVVVFLLAKAMQVRLREKTVGSSDGKPGAQG